MASEWEELEKLSKDELIIELMRERWVHRNINQRLRMIIDYDYPDSNEIPCVVEEDDYSSPGYETTDTWAKKIVLYAKSRCTDEFGPDGVFDYVRTYNPYPAVGIPGSMISASFENFEYSAGALF